MAQINTSDTNRFEAFFKHASMGIVIVNSKGQITAANPFLLSLFRYDEQDLTGQPIEILIPLRYHHNHENHRNAYIKNARSRPMGIGLDLNGIRKDGTEFPVEISLGNYQDKGEVYVIGFITDITTRRKNELEIINLNNHLEETVETRTRELTNTLRELEVYREKLEIALSFQKGILDSAGAMLIVTNNEGMIRFFNPEATHLTGYAPDEVINIKSLLDLHDPADIEKKRKEYLAECGQNNKKDFDLLTIKARENILEDDECRFRRKDGSIFPVSLTVTAIRDNKNQITGFIGVAVDISKRKKAEADLRESLEKEKELSELKSRFVSMASHEFRTPLSTVLSSAYLVEKYNQTDEQPKREKHLQRIISSVNMLTDILNDFLSVGKIEEGKIQVRLSEFNFQKNVDAMVQEMQTNVKKGQLIQYTHEGETMVYLDPSLLKHIVMNLVSNAIKFSSEGTKIAVHTSVSETALSLAVKDNGIGISTDDQEHLMERFYRGANATNIQGTGLGLHIVAKYAELMHGTVHCNSELEKGTTFTVKFSPIKPAS